MKYVSSVFLLILFLLFPQSVSAAITLSISDIEKKDDYYLVTASVSGLASGSACFVEVALTAPGDPHYFGQTWSPKGEWFKYLSSPEKDFIKDSFVPLSNDQPTKVMFKNDIEDPDYKGPGEYLLKLKRFTGGSTSPAGESNSLPLTLSDILITPSPSPTDSPTPTVSPTPTAITSPTSTTTPTPTQTPTKTPTKTPTPHPSVTVPTVKATVTTRPQPSSPITPETASSSGLVLAASATAVISSADPAPLSPSLSASPSASPFSAKNIFFGGLILALSSSLALYFRLRKY